MFWKRKEKLYLGQFLRLYLQVILKSKITLPAFDETGLNPGVFSEELLYFRFVLLLAELSEIGQFGKTHYDSEKLGYLFGQAFVLASKDVGIKDDETERVGSIVWGRLEDYEKYLKGIDAGMLETRGVYFYLISYFSDRVVNKESLKDKKVRDQSFQAFDLGKQVYQNDKKALEQMMKNIEFLD